MLINGFNIIFYYISKIGKRKNYMSKFDMFKEHNPPKTKIQKEKKAAEQKKTHTRTHRRGDGK